MAVTPHASVKLVILLILGNLSMHHLMKSAPTEFSDLQIPLRKEIPMFFGSPRESIELDLSLWDVRAGNSTALTRTPHSCVGCGQFYTDDWAEKSWGFCPLRRPVFMDDQEEDNLVPDEVPVWPTIVFSSSLSNPFSLVRPDCDFFDVESGFFDCSSFKFENSLTFVEPRPSFSNARIGLLFGPFFPDVVPDWFLPFANEYDHDYLITWDKALYFSLRASCTWFLIFCSLPFLIRYAISVFLISILRCISLFLYFGYLAFSWLFYHSLRLCYLFSFFYSVRCIFGISIVPFACIVVFILVRDMRTYSLMSGLSVEEKFLVKSRLKVLLLLRDFSLDRLSRLMRAYQTLGSLGSKRIIVARSKYFYSPSYSIDGKKFFYSNRFCDVLEKDMAKILKVDQSFKTTSGVDNVWNFIHPVLSACGSQIDPKHSLMIQECLLFIGKVVYAMTDSRSVRYAALAADLISFRNTSCGQAMSDAGFEYFGRLAKEFVSEIEIPRSQVPTFRMSDYSSKERALIGAIHADFVPTSFSFSDVSSMLGSLEKGLREQALKRILQLIAIVVALVSFCGQGSFNLEGMVRVTKAIKAQPFDETLDLASQLVSLLKWLGEAGWHLFAFSGSVATTVDAAAVWRKSAEEVLAVKTHANYANILGTGVVDTDGNKIPLSVFRARVATLIKLDWKLVESTIRITSSKFVASEFKAIHQRLVAFDSELQAQIMTQTYRKAPFGLALVGGTAVGKSTITNLIFAYYSAIRGIDHLPEMIFSHPSFTEFWDTYFGQDYILFDDVGAVHPQSKAVDSSLFDILQVVNNAPYVVPMAQADQKGTRCVTSKLVIATSNQEDLGARTMFATPGAVLRRFGLFARMIVKPAFACALGRLDPARIAAFQIAEHLRREANPLERKPYSDRFPPFWDFEILELDQGGITGRTTQVFNNPESATIDFLRFVFENAEAHDRNQVRVMNTFASLKSMRRCSRCLNPEDVCVCLPIGQAIPAPPPLPPVVLPLRPLPPGLIRRIVGANFAVTSLDVEMQEGFSFVFWSALVACFFAVLCIVFLLADPMAFVLSVMWTGFVWVAVIVFSIQCVKGFLISRVHLEPVTSSARLPLTMLINLFGNFTRSFSDLTRFCSILCAGGFSRKAWFDACMDRMKHKLARFFSTENLMVISLTACVTALIAGPLYKLFFSQRWITCSKLDDLDIPPSVPSVKEDSRSVYYNPNPPQRTTSERSKCLSGSSSSPWIENSLRRSTCILRFFDVKDNCIGELNGLAIGGSLILTMAHAVVRRTVLQCDSEELLAVRGTAVFPSIGSAGSSTHKFNLTKSTSVVDLEHDFFLFDVPSLPARCSLVDYFLETNDVLDDSYVCRLLQSSGWNFVSEMCRTTFELGSNFSSRFFKSGFSFSSPIEWGPGHSGSVLVAQSKSGTVILGLQAMADANKTILTNFIGRSYLKGMIRRLVSTPNGQFSFIPKGPVIGLNSTPEVLGLEPTRSNPLLHDPLNCKQENFSFVGALQTACGKGDSRFGHPPYREFFLTRGYVCDKVAPSFDYKSKRHYLQQVGKISHDIDEKIVNLARDTLLEHWVNKYTSEDELKLLKPLNLKEAINGSDSVTWVEKLKYATSAGFPWNKPKLSLLEVRSSDEFACGHEYFLPPNLSMEFGQYISGLVDGEPMNYPYKGTQKDEPISEKKNTSRGPRIFCAANLFVILAGRMLFGSYIRIAQRNFFISWAAVGINAASKVWGLLWLWISAFGTHRIMAGDYSNFDQNMSPLFTRAAYAVIVGLMEASGNFNPDLLAAARSWASETINPTVILDGDIFDIAGTNPSGNPLTVHINCIVNILFILYVWIAVGNCAKDFFDNVRMMTYGDDNLIAVRDSVGNFNYWIIHTKLSEIGVTYTPADKSDPRHKEFDCLTDITFLKRGFLLRDGFYYAPLELASFAKTFTCWMCSDQDDQSHGLDTLCSCWENAAHLDPSVREKVHQDILDACESLSWPVAQFKPVVDLEQRFRSAEVNRWPEMVAQSGLVDNHFLMGLGFLPCFGNVLEGGIQVDPNSVHIVFYAPAFEEGIKQALAMIYCSIWLLAWGHNPLKADFTLILQNMLVFVGIGFGLFELVVKYHQWGFQILPLAPFVMHSLIGFFPYHIRIVLHMVWNACCILLANNCATGCMFCVYNSEWPALQRAQPGRFMFHGLTFTRPVNVNVLTRWYSIQDSTWVTVLQGLEPDQAAGPGVAPVLDQQFVDDEEPDDIGCFDGFYLVDGPVEDSGEDGGFGPPSGPE